MKNSKTATTSDAQAELKRIKAASASLVRRAKKNPAVAHAFLDSIGFYTSKSKGSVSGSVKAKTTTCTVSPNKSSAAKHKSVHKTATSKR